MNRKHHKFAGMLVPLLIAFGIGLMLGQNIVLPASNAPGSPLTNNQLNLDTYWDVWRTVHNKYIDARHINDQEAVYGSIKGMVYSLGDAHSDYMDPSETRFFKSDLDSELEGIGAELIMSNGLLTIVSPLKSSPAEKAGLKPNDIIIEINGEDSTSLNLLEAIGKIRGEKGTQVSLTIYREGLEEPFPVQITREQIFLESITTEQLENDIFYISINQFSNDTTKEFFNAVSESLLANSKGIVLDLRYNGGGYLDVAVEILGEFLPRGKEAVIVETSAARTKDTLKTAGAARLQGMPVVVLVNEGSASAAEIMAGAMQDYEIATLLGEKTYGKGTVQEVYTLDDGSALRLTIAEWFTPLGRGIDGEGLMPDIEVALTEQDAIDGKDPQLEAAINFLNSL